jgi:hypothetical protein
MRRVIVLLLLFAAAAGGAAGAPLVQATGKITKLDAAHIRVAGMTCRLGKDAAGTRAGRFSLGNVVKIVCRNGVLTSIEPWRRTPVVR